jgi:hypothetical protein
LTYNSAESLQAWRFYLRRFLKFCIRQESRNFLPENYSRFKSEEALVAELNIIFSGQLTGYRSNGVWLLSELQWYDLGSEYWIGSNSNRRLGMQLWRQSGNVMLLTTSVLHKITILSLGTPHLSMKKIWRNLFNHGMFMKRS